MTDIVLYPGEASPNDIRLRAVETIGAFKIGVPIHAGAGATQPRQVYYQSLFVPIYLAAAAVVAQPEGWQAPLSVAPNPPKAQQGFVTGPFGPPLVTTLDWQQPLSIALPPAKPPAGASFVPFDTAQRSVNFTNFGWHGPTSTAPKVAQAQVGYSFVPYNTAQLAVNYTSFGWYLPLSPAPPVAKAWQGDSFVPYNTAQLVVAAYTNFWLQPLSVAVPVVRAVQGDSFVPFDTVQTAAAVSTAIAIPLDAGSAAPRLRTTYYQARFEPPYVPPVIVTPAVYGWWNALSTAPPVARAQLADWSLPYTIVNAVGVAWQSPLAVAPGVAKVQQGFAAVPYYPAQPVAGIAGIAWFTPLWSVPTRNLTAPQGNSSVPFDTAQTATTPGRRKPTLFIANVGRLMNH